MWKDVLRDCRYHFGEPPRSLSFGQKSRFRIWPPNWCIISLDPLLKIYFHQGRLRDGGRIVWGHIVQANRLLFEPGSFDCPANVVYDPDPPGVDDPTLLTPIAHQIFDLKGQRHADPELDDCSRWTTDEMSRIFDAPVPKRLTGGRSLVFSTIMVHRKHLPMGYLFSSFFPLVVNPEETSATMILPCDYWPEGVEELGT